jgi:hypothetical protein
MLYINSRDFVSGTNIELVNYMAIRKLDNLYSIL